MDQSDKAPSVQVRQNEALAQKLYGLCRDSSSAFKTLTGYLRNLRNVLGEIDEIVDSSQGTSIGYKLALRLTQCRGILEKLDITFTSWKCTNRNDIEGSVIAAVRSELELATQDLLDVHAAIQKFEEPASSISAKSDLSSELSSNVNRGASANTSPSDNSSPPQDQRAFSDEKEALEASSPKLTELDAFHVPIDARNTNHPELLSQWRSLLYQPDPLSMPLGEASQSILEDTGCIDPRLRVDRRLIAVDTRENRRSMTSGISSTSATPLELSAGLLPIQDRANEAVTVKAEAETDHAEEMDRDDSTSGVPKEREPSQNTVTQNPDPESNPRTPPQRQSEPTHNPSSPLHSPQETVIRERPPSPAPTHDSEDLYRSTPPRSPTSVNVVAFPVLPPIILSPGLAESMNLRTGRTGARRSYDASKWFAAHAEGMLHKRSVTLATHIVPSPRSRNLREQKTPAPTDNDAPVVAAVTPTILVDGQEIAGPKPTRYRARRPTAPSASPLSGSRSVRERASSTGDLPRDIEKSPVLQIPSPHARPVHRRSVDEALRTNLSFIKSGIEENGLLIRSPTKPISSRRLATKSTREESSTREEKAPTGAPAQNSLTSSPPSAPWSPEFVGRGPSGTDNSTSFGPDGVETSSVVALDEEYVVHIVHFFNNQNWVEARNYLTGWLDNLTSRSEAGIIRRVRHLLGVIASLQGRWEEAVKLFISVIKKPVTSTSELDDGDCAAAYWLGDLYAMNNQRADALLAYAMAERSTMASQNQNYLSTLGMEQDTSRLGLSKPDYKERWVTDSRAYSGKASRLTHPSVVLISAAKLVLDNVSNSVSKTPPDFSSTFYLDCNSCRADYLAQSPSPAKASVDNATKASNLARDVLSLNANTFSQSATWPVPFDPLFSMGGIAQGRLLAFECDMLTIVTSNASIKLPRPSLTKLDHFTTTNPLPWLVTTIRTTLQTLEISYSEVVNVQGTWFRCRYPALVGKIATMNYFSIKLLRAHMGSGYAVDIVSDKLCSARVFRNAGGHGDAMNVDEMKRLKKLVRGRLEAAVRDRKAAVGVVEKEAAAATAATVADMELVEREK